MQKTDNRLMEARYKVIARYPRSKFKIGDIIEQLKCPQDTANIWFCKPDDLVGHVAESIEDIERCTAIFRKLEWWEERTADEMPEYVRYQFKEKPVEYLRISKWQLEGVFRCGYSDGFAYHVANLTPATLEEYTQFTTPTNGHE